PETKLGGDGAVRIRYSTAADVGDDPRRGATRRKNYGAARHRLTVGINDNRSQVYRRCPGRGHLRAARQQLNLDASGAGGGTRAGARAGPGAWGIAEYGWGPRSGRRRVVRAAR